MLWIISLPDMVPQPYHMRFNNTNMKTGKRQKNIYMRYNISYSTTESLHTWNDSSVWIIQQCQKGTNCILNRTAPPPHLPLIICPIGIGLAWKMSYLIFPLVPYHLKRRLLDYLLIYNLTWITRTSSYNTKCPLLKLLCTLKRLCEGTPLQPLQLNFLR